MKTPDTLSSGCCGKVPASRGEFYAETQSCAEIPEISDTAGAAGRWGLLGQVGYVGGRSGVLPHCHSSPPSPILPHCGGNCPHWARFPRNIIAAYCIKWKTLQKWLTRWKCWSPTEMHFSCRNFSNFKFNQVWHFHSLVSLKIIMKWMMMTFFVICS